MAAAPEPRVRAGDGAPAAAPKRGRPRGETEQGREARRRLYEIAIRLVGRQGYEATTLRDIAEEAGVSPALLYRYFPSKRAVVLELYDQLSLRYVEEARTMPEGSWGQRFLWAVRTSLSVLRPERRALLALGGVLAGGGAEGVLDATTAFSRVRVQGVFADAVHGASDRPVAETAEALGRLLYTAHLGLNLFWILDRSPGQRATTRLLQAVEGGLPMISMFVGMGTASEMIRVADAVCRDALFAEGAKS